MIKVVETDEEIMERIRERFNYLEDMTRAVKAGTVRSMIVSGSAGIGKSHGIEKVLKYHDPINNPYNTYTSIHTSLLKLEKINRTYFLS